MGPPEYLRKVFTKLGVNSRRELTGRWRTSGRAICRPSHPAPFTALTGRVRLLPSGKWRNSGPPRAFAMGRYRPQHRTRRARCERSKHVDPGLEAV